MSVIKRIKESLIGRYKSYKTREANIQALAKKKFYNATGKKRHFNPETEDRAGKKKYNEIEKSLRNYPRKK